MKQKENLLKTIKDFKSKHAIDAADENVITIIHLMNKHRLDFNQASEQSSRGAGDHGIDGWHYDTKENHLFIYQSKLSWDKRYVLGGLEGLEEANEFLGEIIIDGELEKTPTNPAIYNLYSELSQKTESIGKISFILISPLNENDLVDAIEYQETKEKISKSRLYTLINDRMGNVKSEIEEYNDEKPTSIPNYISKYPITKLKNPKIQLREKTYLEITFIPLYNLVHLYRQRGTLLFHKNIRLSLTGEKNKVAKSMKDTLEKICQNENGLSHAIFPYYHSGVTIAATMDISETPDEKIELREPFIINGCQTITIADDYLRTLEKKKNEKAIEIFKSINVMAKVVIGTSSEELKQITNCNNRQNPIESWQLFANDNIHIEIEHALKEKGILYERQKGKLDQLKKVDNMREYPNTRETCVQILTLGQIISLVNVIRDDKCQWAAKPALIFENQQNHDSIFTDDIPNYARDIILFHNLIKAAKSSLTKYLSETEVHNNYETWSIFNKPLVKAFVHRTALLYYYQKKEPHLDFVKMTYKIAHSALNEEFVSIYRNFILKVKDFYLKEQDKSKDKNKVSDTKLSDFFKGLLIELGIDTEKGKMPFSENAIDWSEQEEEEAEIDKY